MVYNFLFHRVNPQRDSLWDPMDPVLFEKCIRYISSHFQIVPLEESLNDSRFLKASKKPFATILFDDGYKDNIQFAAPILQKYACPTSFYVVTESITNNIPPWTQLIEWLFVHTHKTDLALDYDLLPSYAVSQLKKYSLKTTEQRLQYVRTLKPILKNVTHVHRGLLIGQIQNAFNDVIIPNLMMSWQDVQQLQTAGFTIGSHTASHALLGTILDEETVFNELNNSAQTIQQHLGFFPATISYPVGSYNDVTIRLSQKVGYKYGLAVKQKRYFPEKDSVWEIPRIELYNESWPKTFLRIHNFIERLKTLVK